MKICIDPGHGGNDTGAIGPTGLEEANTALLISQYLAGYLLNLDIEILLTRETDIFITLGARCNLANNWAADCFVSVHLNSNGPTAKGVETLYSSDLGHELAIPIQAALVDATGDTDRGCKMRNDLFVLNATMMPSVLVECGFISHPEWEAPLKTEDYQMLVANAIGRGIQDFLS